MQHRRNAKPSHQSRGHACTRFKDDKHKDLCWQKQTWTWIQRASRGHWTASSTCLCLRAAPQLSRQRQSQLRRSRCPARRRASAGPGTGATCCDACRASSRPPGSASRRAQGRSRALAAAGPTRALISSPARCFPVLFAVFFWALRCPAQWHCPPHLCLTMRAGRTDDGVLQTCGAKLSFPLPPRMPLHEVERVGNLCSLTVNVGQYTQFLQVAYYSLRLVNQCL